ncbi:MAG: hypothetical protein AB1938_23945 [Myxococcota bacterium]
MTRTPATKPNPAKAAKEKARLDAVKANYRAAQAGKTGAQLTSERKSQQARLGDALDTLRARKAALALARTPLARLRAQQLVTQAEKNARTEYARTAAITAMAPLKLRHQELHDYADRLAQLPLKKLKGELAAVDARLEANAYRHSYEGRVEQRMDVVKQAIVQQAIARVGKTAPVKPTDATRNPGNVVFEGPGMFVATASAMDPRAWAQKLKDAGVTWVALQINNNGPVASNMAELEKGWAAPFKAAGIKVGFWGVSYTQPEKDAQDAAQLTARFKGDFYIADCEGDFQFGQGDVGRNKRFVDSFQAEATKQGIGKIPRALSSMGRVALDMKPWLDNGWDAMPQAYWNSYEHYSPSLSVKYYTENGWPKGRVHPTIATYDGSSEGNARPKSIEEYAADLKRSGTKGFSYYLPESYLDDVEFAELTRALKNGMNG